MDQKSSKEIPESRWRKALDCRSTDRAAAAVVLEIHAAAVSQTSGADWFLDKQHRYAQPLVSSIGVGFALGRNKEDSAMLILTRWVGESLVIGDKIVVRIVGVKGTQVRIGVDAPPEVAVHREEVYERIAQERISEAD